MDALCGGAALILAAVSVGCYIDGQHWPALYSLLLAVLIAVLWNGLAAREKPGE